MSWADRISRVTEDERFMTARIRIVFETEPGVYDVQTNETTGQVIETLYGGDDEEGGKARVIAIRTSVYRQAAAGMNSRATEFVRVQIPKNSVGRVLTGAAVHILSAPDAPFLEGRILTVQSDFHGATSASRTFECAYDNDSVLDNEED